MKKLITKITAKSLLSIGIIVFLFGGFSSLSGNNGIVFGWHYNTADWRQAEQGITANRGRQLTVTTGSPLYGTSGAGAEATAGGNVGYSAGWDNGSGTKGWVFPMTTSGFTNLTLTFYQKSTIQLGTYGPRDFQLQYSTNGGSSWSASIYNYTLTSAWQQFSFTLPAACENQATLSLRWIMRSNTSLNGTDGIDPTALSSFADVFINGNEIPLPITDLNLSNTGILSSAASGSTVGTFSVVDANVYDTYTYSLAAGAGDTHNSSFTITGNNLKTSAVLSPGNYFIRVQVSDGTYTRVENYTIVSSAYPIITVGDPNANSDAWITRVQFGTIDKSSAMSGVNNALGYSNYTAEVNNVVRGTSQNLTITGEVANTYTEYLRVYFDWNHDFDLTDPGEKIDLLVGSTSTGVISATLSINIPADAVLGNTLMRTVLDNNANLALGGSDYGEVEDYTVNIQAPVISFTGGSSFTTSITYGAVNQAIGRFKLTGDVSGGALTAVSIKLDGTRTGLSNLKLWSSTNDTFGGDVQLGSTLAVDPGDGNSASFTFSSPITTSGVYYFITGDLAADATGTVQPVIVENSSLTISSGILTGTITNAALSDASSVLPVELSSFTANKSGNGIELKWKTATEVNNFGFEVERQVGSRQSTVGSIWEKIGFVTGAGNSNSPKEYSFVDENPSSGKVQYRLKQINTDGSFGYYNQLAEVNYNITDVKDKQLPTEFALEQNYPNPFNPSTKIRYQIPTFSTSSHLAKGEDRGGVQEGLVMLKVYDILGNEVATLVNEHKAPGYYEVEFDGSTLSTGVYIYRLTAGSFTATKKLVLMK